MRKVYTAIFTLSIAACLAIANISTLSSQEKALKKLYISSIQASGVPEPLAKKARERIEFALYENFGREYRVLTDEDVKVMFKKAQAIMATGCTAESCQTELADAVDADEIIYGELSRDGGSLRLTARTLLRDRKTLAITKKSMVVLSFADTELDHYASEAAKKLINPAYAVRKPPAIVDDGVSLAAVKIEEVKGLDIAVMRFTSDDATIQTMIAYLKGLVEEGDEAYGKKQYDVALGKYTAVLDRIETRLTPEKQKKIEEFTTGVKRRCDSVYAVQSLVLESKGDVHYKAYQFQKAFENYSAAINLLEKRSTITKDKILNRYTVKKDTTMETGRSYLLSRVRALVDRAELFNLQDRKNEARTALLEARKLLSVDLYLFSTPGAIETYDDVAAVIGNVPLVKSLVIGERGPAGGVVFYDKGTYSEGWRYLEASLGDQDAATWGCFGESIREARGTSIGAGKRNTQAIIAGCGEADIAAKRAAAYRGGGKDDWFLPSKDELALMYRHLKQERVCGFADVFYWSSSEYDANHAWSQKFSNGNQANNNKLITYRVRAVRAF